MGPQLMPQLSSYNQSPRKPAWLVTAAGHIGSHLALLAGPPQAPLVPETLPLKTPPGLPTVQVPPGPQETPPVPISRPQPRCKDPLGWGSGLLSTLLTTTRIRQSPCRPLCSPLRAHPGGPGQTTGSSVPVSAFPISPTSLSLGPPPICKMEGSRLSHKRTTGKKPGQGLPWWLSG